METNINSNLTELVEDYEKDGEKVFERFAAPKVAMLENQLRLITAIIERWSENPLAEDLKSVALFLFTPIQCRFK